MNSTMVDDFCKLRLLLFEELGEINSTSDINSLEKATQKYYLSHIDKDLISWSIRVEDKIIATGSLCLFNRIPYEENLTGVEGYILNIYTIPTFRKQGFAKLLINVIIEYAKENHIKRLWLSSSEHGKPIYSECGFIMKSNEMELFLP